MFVTITTQQETKAHLSKGPLVCGDIKQRRVVQTFLSVAHGQGEHPAIQHDRTINLEGIVLAPAAHRRDREPAERVAPAVDVLVVEPVLQFGVGCGEVIGDDVVD